MTTGDTGDTVANSTMNLNLARDQAPVRAA